MQDGRAHGRGAGIEPAVMRLDFPPGVLGPDAVTVDVRSFVVIHADGVVLVDAGPPDSPTAIAAALDRVQRTWSDVTDIVLTHAHFDHIGGLPEVIDRAPSARLWAGAADVAEIAAGERSDIEPLRDGDRVRDLRVVDTPGHTPGHIGLVHETTSTLFVGDLIGTVNGVLSTGPEAFTPMRSSLGCLSRASWGSTRIASCFPTVPRSRNPMALSPPFWLPDASTRTPAPRAGSSASVQVR